MTESSISMNNSKISLKITLVETSQVKLSRVAEVGYKPEQDFFQFSQDEIFSVKKIMIEE